MLQRIVDHDGSDLHARGERTAVHARARQPHARSRTCGPIDRSMLAGVIGALTERRPNLRGEFDHAGEADLSYELDGRRALPREHLQGARSPRADAARDPGRGAAHRRHRRAAGAQGSRARAPRAGAGDRRDGLGQDDHARGHDRPHQPRRRRSTSSRSRTRSRSCTPNHQSIVSQREVGADTLRLPAGAAARAAPGPGRDPDRRDPRRGDDAHGARRCGDRPPRARDAPHDQRAGDDRARARPVPVRRRAAGARDARGRAQGHRVAAPGQHDRRQAHGRRRGDGLTRRASPTASPTPRRPPRSPRRSPTASTTACRRSTRR